MTLTVEIITADIVLATEYASLHITEQIGQPDSFTVEAVGFTSNALFTQPVVDLFANPDNYFYTTVRLDSDILFNGLIRGPIGIVKDYPGQMRYSLRADGWQFIMPLRKVGVPGGSIGITVDDDDPQRLPTVIQVDPNAIASPTAAGVQSLFNAYWNYPQIDTYTFVENILPAEGTGGELTWSGSDLEGATNDLAAAGSAAALWWIANDSPDPQNITAPNLALHFGVVTLPDAGEEIDDLLLGLPSAELPTNLAPYNLSDDPDWTSSIMPESMTFTVDHTAHRASVYVRGATGWVTDVLPAPPGWPVPYQVGLTHTGGTGWVGNADGGIWGADYVDAPAAISAEQRDAFGQAYLAAKQIAAWTGTAVVRSVNPLGGAAYDGWHKGQAIQVTDADHGFDGRWFLIRGVDISLTDPEANDIEYSLSLGDVLSPSLGYALRTQRLDETRKPVDPAVKFVPYDGDLLPSPGGTSPETFQLATESGSVRKVEGVGAVWHLLVNGADLDDVTDTAGLFWLTDRTLVTDANGQVTATLHAATFATIADDANVWVSVVLP